MKPTPLWPRTSGRNGFFVCRWLPSPSAQQVARRGAESGGRNPMDLEDGIEEDGWASCPIHSIRSAATPLGLSFHLGIFPDPSRSIHLPPLVFRAAQIPATTHLLLSIHSLAQLQIRRLDLELLCFSPSARDLPLLPSILKGSCSCSRPRAGALGLVPSRRRRWQPAPPSCPHLCTRLERLPLTRAHAGLLAPVVNHAPVVPEPGAPCSSANYLLPLVTSPEILPRHRARQAPPPGTSYVPRRQCQRSNASSTHRLLRPRASPVRRQGRRVPKQQHQSRAPLHPLDRTSPATRRSPARDLQVCGRRFASAPHPQNLTTGQTGPTSPDPRSPASTASFRLPLLCFLSGRGTHPAFPALLDLLEVRTSALTAPARLPAAPTGPKPMVSLLRAPLPCALLVQYKFQPVDIFIGSGRFANYPEFYSL
ncbi:uncharacterized protein [Triticum aestivum]|uniref:uncharacterized protein n=1 Tax=Triticum aestivum TaxID=4565 RepID=UPI001D00F2DE|nr:uncharacterized protein LOC123129681 [Triticum aestivum]